MYYILFVFWYLFSLLPMRVHYILSDLIYVFVYHIARYRKTLVKKNLSTSFPQKSEAELHDIEKRYYLKYPNWAYKIGKGGQFEVLNITGAVSAMVEWVDKDVDNTIHVIKDPELLDINELIKAEKAEGRAKHVICLPRWIVVCGYGLVRVVFGKSNKTYLVFKALWPFRTSEE